MAVLYVVHIGDDDGGVWSAGRKKHSQHPEFARLFTSKNDARIYLEVELTVAEYEKATIVPFTLIRADT